MDFREQYRRYKELVDRRLVQLERRHAPRSLYEPIGYALDGKGKRVRPVLTLLACEAVGGKPASALDAAVAVEVLHNFTLVHDDIMDNAHTRRGRKTVHRKWGPNTAILAGDQMIALAYQTLMRTKAVNIRDILETFTKGFYDVCEGQGLDEELEHRKNVSMRNYLQMIGKKTAAMIVTATTMGAIIGGGVRKEIAALRTYGEYLGRAFQIQDDLLDVVADEKVFGKTIGGDLKEGKKTYLLLRGIERSSGKNRSLLLRVAGKRNVSDTDVAAVRTIFERTGILDETRTMVRQLTQHAKQALQNLRSGTPRDMLRWLADELLRRAA